MCSLGCVSAGFLNSKLLKHKKITCLTLFSAGPWTVFAPTNTAFMNLPMKELEDLITNPKKLSKLVLNHLINKLVF
jgi:uncharacterized surface protein with fasciclin (FAS1) repeats